MKLLSIALFTYCLSVGSTNAQNLVPNPEFELRDSNYCGISSSTDLADALSDWYSPTSGTPDVFFTDISSTCWNFQPNSIYPGPIGLKGDQLPRSGASMAGMVLYTIPSQNQREYIQVELISPMVSGGKYVVECYVSLADYTEFASNGLGFHLSTGPISSSNGVVLALTPQYATASIIDDTQNWVRVFDTITISDAFQFLTIGNFSDDVSTALLANPTASFEPGMYGAYYFIDDVRVERVFNDPPVGLDQLNILNVHLFPNPVNDEVHIELPDNEEDFEIKLTDANGKLVWSIKGRLKHQLLDMSNFDDGIYFIQVESTTGTYMERIVKN